METQRRALSTWGRACAAAAQSLGSTWRLLQLVPYLCDLLPATPAGQIPPGSVAFIRKTNVFYHPFHPRMKAETETRSLAALRRWATLPGAAGCSLCPQQMGKEGQRGRTGACSSPCLCLKNNPVGQANK